MARRARHRRSSAPSARRCAAAARRCRTSPSPRPAGTPAAGRRRARCVTSGSVATEPFSGPLSTAVTRRPRCASCHVQPPGAAPRSTARIPGRSSGRSSSPRNVVNASASLSVDRDGAPPGMRKRGMPIGHSLSRASLVPTNAVPPSGRNTCSRAARRREVATSRKACSTRSAECAGERRELLAFVGIGKLDPHRAPGRSSRRWRWPPAVA